MALQIVNRFRILKNIIPPASPGQLTSTPANYSSVLLVKNSLNSASSFWHLSYIFFACSSVSRLFHSLETYISPAQIASKPSKLTAIHGWTASNDAVDYQTIWGIKRHAHCRHHVKVEFLQNKWRQESPWSPEVTRLLRQSRIPGRYATPEALGTRIESGENVFNSRD